MLDKDILVKGYRITKSKFDSGDCLTLHISFEDEDRIIFTGSRVLAKQIENYKDMIPFETKIKIVNKYMTFS